MDKCKILVPVGCRSDEGLSAPIIKRLKKNKLFEVYDRKLEAGDFYQSYQITEMLSGKEGPYDLIFITGDRVEMTAVASWAFHNYIPIVHYYGGVLNDPISTLDDINRHCISLWSDIQFVESKLTLLNLEVLFRAIKKKPNSHIVGITHMEDIEPDESKVPDEEYDLVLINAVCSEMSNDWKKWKAWHFDTFISIRDGTWKRERLEVWIESNPDFDIKSIGKNDIWFNNLPRNQFLGLLKNCKRFITNSSAGIYEAPYFLKPSQIVMIGDRNKNRQAGFYDELNPIYRIPASELITMKLETWWRKRHEKK